VISAPRFWTTCFEFCTRTLRPFNDVRVIVERLGVDLLLCELDAQWRDASASHTLAFEFEGFVSNKQVHHLLGIHVHAP
jgi:hypothetical protein